LVRIIFGIVPIEGPPRTTAEWILSCVTALSAIFGSVTASSAIFPVPILKLSTERVKGL
jgi:hypothetical protein